MSTASASEPVSTSTIIGKLTPITGEEEGRSIDLDITFELGSARLSESARAQLNALGEALISPQLADMQIGVYGHTDASGKASYNKTLSEKRAASVKTFLVENFAIANDRLFAAGYGEEKLKNTNNPNAAENRRVQIVNLTPMKSQPVQSPAKAVRQPAFQVTPPSAPATPAPAPVQGGGMQSIN
ncbi:MAG: OmpA family protein, partial [Rhodospirillales bacterium]|nr:OmpA family protein [Rhodospirillales bacterium]